LISCLIFHLIFNLTNHLTDGSVFSPIGLIDGCAQAFPLTG
jgi:hypothetical protein